MRGAKLIGNIGTELLEIAGRAKAEYRARRKATGPPFFNPNPYVFSARSSLSRPSS